MSPVLGVDGIEIKCKTFMGCCIYVVITVDSSQTKGEYIEMNLRQLSWSCTVEDYSFVSTDLYLGGSINSSFSVSIST